ncbi:MAG: RluA family pseudouridine synthase [Propioniciclava sp.]
MSVHLVPDGLAGERVDTAAARMTGVSRSRVAELLNEGLVSLNGAVVGKSARVAAGDLLELELPAPRVAAVQPRLADGVEIVYDDTDIVVVNKPAGVAAHPSLGWDGPDVVSHLAGAGFRISTSGAAERQGIVQRLDVGTSGLMVVAKSERAYTVLKRAFRNREVEKVYHAVAQGHPDPFVGTIDAPIGRDPSHDWRMAIVDGGRQSVTHYSTLEAFRAATLLEVNLETGRTHQIRVHLAAIKHPCVGDPLYGADPTLASRLGLSRQWLHAVKLEFLHPGTGEWSTYASDYPADLAAALQQLASD